MGYARVCSIALVGVVGAVVVVEADVTAGLPRLVVSGLPDAALTESRDRVRAAVVNSGERWPQQRLTVNLLPAHLPKHGSGFDLAVATAILAAAGALPVEYLDGIVVLGELGLDGTVRPVRGALPAAVAAARAGAHTIVVPVENAAEAQLVSGVNVLAADSLARLVRFARGAGPLLDPPEPVRVPEPAGPDLCEVLGQERGRRAIAVCAAGGHHLAMIGPPGAGKTMLAQRLPSVLPTLDDAAAQEVTAIHSVAGTLPTGSPMLRRPPFQAPHHTASAAALVGGGAGLARPGALSLAHNGVLFLDEAPEFRSSVLNALRQPIEDGEVRLRRAGGETVYPARAQLILAANPCPCASPAGDRFCQCSPLARRRYLGRLSGPLLDRIDLTVALHPVRSVALLGSEQGGESSKEVAVRVAAARAAAVTRWTVPRLGGTGSADHRPELANATVTAAALRAVSHRLPGSVLRTAARAVDQGRLSARGFERVLRVAWSIADLDGHDRPDPGDVAEALELRTGVLT